MTSTMWLIVLLASTIAFIAGALIQAFASAHLVAGLMEDLEREGIVRIVGRK